MAIHLSSTDQRVSGSILALVVYIKKNIIGQDTEPLNAPSRSSIGVLVPMNCSLQASSALHSSLNVSLNG